MQHVRRSWLRHVRAVVLVRTRRRVGDSPPPLSSEPRRCEGHGLSPSPTLPSSDSDASTPPPAAPAMGDDTGESIIVAPKDMSAVIISAASSSAVDVRADSSTRSDIPPAAPPSCRLLAAPPVDCATVGLGLGAVGSTGEGPCARTISLSSVTIARSSLLSSSTLSSRAPSTASSPCKRSALGVSNPSQRGKTSASGRALTCCSSISVLATARLARATRSSSCS